MHWIRQETYIKTPKNFKYINEDREVFFLTRDEVQKIKEFDEFEISNEKHLEYLPKNTPLQSWYLEDKVDTKIGIKRYTSYEVYKDMLLFLCGIGCRFGDLVKLKVSNFEFDNSTPKPKKGESFEGGRKGIFVFNMEKSKTNKQIRVPINQLTYDIFKKYPHSIDVKIEKTKFLAKINKNGQIFYIGSNGKFIKNSSLNNELPFIFGNPEVFEFFKIKEIIDKSKISYTEIKNLYFFPSKRWDLEFKNNTIIKLPNDNINFVLNLAIEFLDDNKFIDARIKNQIILND